MRRFSRYDLVIRVGRIGGYGWVAAASLDAMTMSGLIVVEIWFESLSSCPTIHAVSSGLHVSRWWLLLCLGFTPTG